MIVFSLNFCDSRDARRVYLISALSDAIATSICVLSGLFVVMYWSHMPGMVNCLMITFFWCFAENLRNS